MCVCSFKELQTLVFFCPREIGLFILTFGQSRGLAEGILARADMHLLGKLPLKKKCDLLLILLIFLTVIGFSQTDDCSSGDLCFVMADISEQSIKKFSVTISTIVFSDVNGFFSLLECAQDIWSHLWCEVQLPIYDFFPYITIKNCSFFEFHFNRYPQKWSYF